MTGDKWVLLVEDDEGTAELERRALSRAGIPARIAPRLKDALEALELESFSAAILDYNLPDGDPWRVVAAAKAKTPPVPVIVVTAAGTESVAAEALHHGVAEYIMKADSFLDRLAGVVTRVARAAETEHQLRRSEALFQLIVHNTSDVIGISDLHGVLKYVSPACHHLYGQTPEELIGTSILDFIHPGDVATAEQLFAGLERSGHGCATYRRRRKDGSHLWVEAVTTVLRDARTGLMTETVSIVRDISERKRAEDLVLASLREKELLLKEIHHRVKNNLQIVSSLFNLQAHQSPSLPPRDVLANCQRRIESIALVHDQLYQSKDLARLDLQPYIEALVEGIFRTFNQAGRQIRSVIEATGVQMAIDKAIPCGLIISELVTNSLKHAFPAGRAGLIRVALTQPSDGLLLLMVSDNGIGLPDGVDPGRTSTLGLDLVDALAVQIGAQCEVERGPGTAFHFRFSVDPFHSTAIAAGPDGRSIARAEGTSESQ